MSAPERRGGRVAEARRNDDVVLDSARRVFARLGDRATVADIAADAGVGIGTLYRRYPTMRDLTVRVCEVALGECVAGAERSLAEPDPWRGLVSYIRGAVAFRAGVFERAAGSFEPPPTLTELADKAHSHLTELVDRAARSGALRDDVTPSDVHDLITLFSLRDHDPLPRLLTVAVDGLRAGAASTRLAAPTGETHP